MPIRWRSKILLAKPEASYGVDSTPTGADNAILATNIVLTPMEGQDVSRELELPWLAAQATMATGLHVRIQFRVELVPSGSTGVAPAWGPLLVACGCAQVVTPDDEPGDGTVVYNPVSDNHGSAAIHFWIGLTRFVILGTRGTGVMRWTAQGIPYLELDLRGLFAMPSEQARPVPNLSAFLRPDIVTHARTPKFEIDEVPLVMRSFALDLGNRVEPRFLVGSEGILITDKNELASAQVEAVPLTTFNPFAQSLATEDFEVPIELVHGTVAGRRMTLEIEQAQMQRLQSFENSQDILEWPLRMIPLPTEGNDQWTLTLT